MRYQLLYFKYHLLFVVIYNFTVAFGYSQTNNSYFFKRYSSPDELPSQSCSSVYKDHYGFLWIGNAYGISIFNGRDFTNISGYSENKDFYLGDSPQNFLQIDDDRLLITCTNGLFCFYYKTRIVQRININLKKTSADRIDIIGYTENKEGIIIKSAGIVYVFDLSFTEKKKYTCSNESKEVNVKNENTAPACFFYTKANHLARLNTENGHIDSVLLSNETKAVVVNGQNENTYLVVTSKKVTQLNSTTLDVTQSVDVPKQEDGYFFFPRTAKKDGKGNFWIAGESILFVYNPVSNSSSLVNGRISNFSSKKINSYSIYDLWIDHESIFAASYRGGLFEYKKDLNRFTDYFLPDNKNALTYSMIVYNNTILGVNDLQGLYQFPLDKKEPSYTFHPVSTNNGSLLQIEKLDDKNIWALFDEGFKVGLIDKETLVLKTDKLAINNIIRLYFDSVSNFRMLNRDFRPVIKNINSQLSYISVGRSLYKATGTSTSGLTFSLVDTITSVGCISCISSGNIFMVGTTTGELFVLEDNRLIKKATALNTFFLPVKAIDNDTRGNVYSMTAYGVYIYNAAYQLKKVLNKSLSGMIDNKIFSGKMDRHSTLWMATYGGLMSYNTITDQLVNYPSTGIMRNIMFITKAMAFDNDKIFFGGTEGITQVNTAEVREDTIKNTMYFDEVTNGNTRLHFWIVARFNS